MYRFFFSRLMHFHMCLREDAAASRRHFSRNTFIFSRGILRSDRIHLYEVANDANISN